MINDISSSKGRFALLGAAALALVLGLTVPRPAMALDDDGSENVFSAVLGLVGISGEKEDPTIDYRERPPLVVPPNRKALPQPLPPASQRNAAWPQDQEVVRRREAATARARPRVDEVQDPVKMEELRRNRSDGRQAAAPGYDPNCNDPLARVCNPEQMWSTLRNTRSSGADDTKLIPGKEPERAWLTEPPAGYRKATKETKYTFEKAPESDITDAREQAILDRRRRTE